MKLQSLNKGIEIQKFNSILKAEKKNGIKTAWYFYHYGSGQIQCIDTKQQLMGQMQTYSQQNIELVDTTPLSKSLCDRFGVSAGSILTFREMNEKQISPFLDPLAFAFDIVSGTAEWHIFKLHLVKTN